MKKDNQATAAALILLGAIALIPAAILWSAFWSGLAVTVLWGWFIVPLGAVDIGLVHAYGLVLFVNAFTFSGKIKKQNDQDYKLLAQMVIHPMAVCILLLTGWIAKSFM